MDQEQKKLWKLRMEARKHYYRSIYYKVVAFMQRYPPFRYFFYTLTYFEYAEKYKVNLKEEKKRTPWLTREMIREIKERSMREVDEELTEKVEKASKKADEAERRAAREELLSDKIQLKLDQFTLFLIQNVNPEQAVAYTKKIVTFADSDDSQDMYDRLSEYIDSIIEKHTQKTMAGRNIQ